MRVLSLVLAAPAFALSVAFPIAPQDGPPATPQSTAEDKPLMSRRFVVGTSSHVRQLMKDNPQGYQFRRAANDVRVDERAAPKSCGVPLAKYFREQIVSTFSVGTTNDCRISGEQVTCQSHDLPGYTRTYLSLSYAHQPAEVDLVLAIRQRGLWGDVRNPQLAGAHVDWLEHVFDCLISIAECGSSVPRCAATR